MDIINVQEGTVYGSYIFVNKKEEVPEAIMVMYKDMLLAENQLGVNPDLSKLIIKKWDDGRWSVGWKFTK